MMQNLSKLEKEYAELEADLANPEIISDQNKYKKIAQKHNGLLKIVTVWRNLQKMQNDLAEAELLLADSDDDLRSLAEEEIKTLSQDIDESEEELTELLTPTDPNDEKNTILEIRAGTGGEEAALFAADLFRMYVRYAEQQGWKTELLSSNPTDGGGLKEIIVMIDGYHVYSRLKFESGVHRVQRVPDTETQGRVHTSAVTVAVLPEAEEIDVEIKSNEIKIDVFRSSGPGGQSVNTTDSAVRITHLPTGLVVSCQDEKSQHNNREKALRVLRARLLDQMEMEQQNKISEERREQVGSGDRSERIRTYNYQQGRLTDHRAGLNFYRLTGIMDGDLDEIIDAVSAYFKNKRLNGKI